MVELKPCPFCGNPVEIDKNEYGSVFVRCRSCKMILMYGDDDRDVAATAKHWNMREGGDHS